LHRCHGTNYSAIISLVREFDLFALRINDAIRYRYDKNVGHDIFIQACIPGKVSALPAPGETMQVMSSNMKFGCWL